MSNLAVFGQKLDKIGQKLDKNWTKLDKLDKDWTRLDKNWTKLDKNWTNGQKIGQTSLMSNFLNIYDVSMYSFSRVKLLQIGHNDHLSFHIIVCYNEI